MKFEALQKKRLIEKYQASPEEIEAILKASKSDIETAQNLLNTDVCWAFNIAYNSILQTGIAFMHTKGFRPIGEAKHVSVILFLRKALNKDCINDLDRFNQMRIKRNRAVYGILRDITEYEATDSVKFAARFIKKIIEYIEKV